MFKTTTFRRRATVLVALLVVCAVGVAAPQGVPDVVAIGGDRELFVDGYLIDRLEGGARLQLARPRDEGIVLRFDQPWEKRFPGFVTVLHDPPLYRMYYYGWTADTDRPQEPSTVMCYAESADGKRWVKPNLGLFEVCGTRENNVVLADAGAYSGNLAPFIDTRAGVPADERFKALAGTDGSGLVPFASADGQRWRRLTSDAVLAVENGFDSLNVSFWSERETCYVAYVRVNIEGVRRIARATSLDFLNWSMPALMGYGPAPLEHLYTNMTHPYFRAPHIYVGLAARFLYMRKVLTDEQSQALDVFPGFAGDVSEGVLITTRGGTRYDRTFLEGFLRPGLRPQDWVSRTNFPGNGIVPTGPDEMSFFANHDYSLPTAHVRRYSLRTDGLASVNAPYSGGELLTRPLTFRGRRLVLNYATSAAGHLRVEVQDVSGKPVSSYRLEDAVQMVGNELAAEVRWRGGPDLTPIAGQTVRLRFEMKDADLFSLQFE
jgi:hypothetical protein